MDYSVQPSVKVIQVWLDEQDMQDLIFKGGIAQINEEGTVQIVVIRREVGKYGQK